MSTVGQRIREYRQKAGKSQVELAKAIGVSKQTLYKYENDIITNIPSDKIELAAKVLDVSPAALMGWGIDQENGQPEYYIDPETAKLAQMFLTDPDYRLLYEAARGSHPEDVRMAADMLKRFKEARRE